MGNNPMGHITYRQATADDLEALARLRWAMQVERQLDHPSDPETWDTYLAAYRDAFADQMRHGGFDAWLAEDHGQAVSCVVLLWWRTPPIFDQLVRRRGMVSSVYTLPEYRRKGIARKLMRMLIAEAKELQIRRLVLWASTMGRPMYESIGFEPSDGMELDAIEFSL
jgi:GNAT superfamily N-acetyltransferase